MARALSVEILGDASHFAKELDKAAGKTKRFGKAAGVAGAALVGVLAVGIEKSIHAAMGMEVANAKLDKSFKNAHLSALKYAGAVKEAETQGRKLGFTDQDSATSLASLITATKSYQKARIALNVAQDIARFKGVSLTDATKMLTMAMTGSQRAAKQLGISVQPVTKNFDALGKKATTAEKAHAKFLDKMATGNAVIDSVNGHLKGQADAYAKTAAGGVDKLKASMDHLKVTAGEELLPVMKLVADKVTAFLEYLQAHPNVAKALAAGFIVLTGALLLAAAAAAAMDLALLANPVGAVVLGILALAAALVIAYNKFETFRNIVNGAIDVVRNHWQTLILFIPGLGVAIGLIIGHFQRFKSIVAEVITTIIGWIDKFLHALQIAAEAASHVPVIGDKFKGVASAIQTARDKLDGFARSLKDLTGVDHVIKVTLDIAANTVATAIQGVAKNVRHRHHALGGRMRAGELGIVGERGAELFVPDRGGRIIPNNRLGMAGAGGMTVNVYAPNYVGTEDVLARAVRKQFDLIRKRGGHV